MAIVAIRIQIEMCMMGRSTAKPPLCFAAGSKTCRSAACSRSMMRRSRRQHRGAAALSARSAHACVPVCACVQVCVHVCMRICAHVCVTRHIGCMLSRAKLHAGFCCRECPQAQSSRGLFSDACTQPPGVAAMAGWT